MSDLRRSPSSNSNNLCAPEDEHILAEDRSAAGSDRASLTSPGAPELRSTSTCDPRGDENEGVPSGPEQTKSINGPRRPARKETFFGISQSTGVPANFSPNYDDNYETRFPPDPIYEEASENARVFRVYMEESAKYDAYMTDEAREGLDVLLVFAGLFSAVLTTFVAQTSQSLMPDRATESTLLLREIAALQRAQINGTSIDSIPHTPADFVPSSIDVWVNGLWFTSLTLSLASALFAVLIKQWLRQYMSLTSGTPRRRTLFHHFRFMGLQKWHVRTLIGILPVLLHLSLAVFFVGLTLFLVPLRRSIAGIVGSTSALVFLASIGTAVWPLFHQQCPYHSPLTDILHGLLVRMDLVQLRPMYIMMDDLVPAFGWLLSMSSNPGVHHVVAQAVGGLLRKSSLIDSLVNILHEEKYGLSFNHAWHEMFDASFSRSLSGACIIPENVDLLERLFRSALHIGDSASFSWILSNSDVCAAIQSFPAPTLQWESAATALLWHHGIVTNEGNFEDAALAQKARAVVSRLILDPREKETLLPPIVWGNLLAAASSCPGILLPDLSDRGSNLNKMMIDELTNRVSARLGPPVMYDDTCPVSFSNALGANENFIWFLLSPFDPYKESPLDSKKVQRLLSLVYAIVSRVLFDVTHELFVGTCKELIGELQAGFVTLNDQAAICFATDALLQERIALQGDFGTNAVLLPALIFLHCWKPHIPLRSARKDVLLDLIEVDMLNILHEIKDWLWSYTVPVVSLVASLIRRSFESRTGPEEDSQWLEYLSLPENSATIVALFMFQGTTDTLASVEQVRDDLVLFFSSLSPDCDTLQQCKTSLESHLEDFVPPRWWDAYGPSMKEARKVIDELLVQHQSTKPVNRLSRFVRRSRKSLADSEARYPRLEPSPPNTSSASFS